MIEVNTDNIERSTFIYECNGKRGIIIHDKNTDTYVQYPELQHGDTITIIAKINLETLEIEKI